MPAFLLDTNILLYLANASAPEHLAAIAAVEKLLASGASLTLAPQVIFEFWSVATRPITANGLGWNVEQTYSALQRFRGQFSILHEPPEVVDIWLDLVVSHDLKGKRIHDAHLLATMKANGVNLLLTLDVADFPAVADLTVLNPDAVLSSSVEEA